MIIEKAYNLDQNIISKSDLSEIKSLLEKYETYELFDILNEKKKQSSNYKYYSSSDFDKTGGSTVRGISGALQSIPSFAITAAISPTIAVLAGLGALSHRMRQRWEDKESWRNRLLPGFWVDNLANPGHEHSLTHRVVAAPFNIIKGAGALALGSAAGYLGWDTVKKKMEEKGEDAPNWLKKLFGIGTAAGVYNKVKEKDSSLDTSVNFDENLTLTPEDVKNIDFREFWLTLSNGEIYRVKADSEKNAKELGLAIIALGKLPNSYYPVLNKQIEDRKFKRFQFYFDDGEMCYSAGKDQKEALKNAQNWRSEICKQLNDSDKGLIPIDPLSNPKIDGVAGNPKSGVLIEVPDSSKIKVSTTKPNGPKREKRTLKIPAYAYEGMEDYKINLGDFQIHFPAFNEREALEMARTFYKDHLMHIKGTLERNIKRHDNQFKVKMGDGDYYYIDAPDKSMAAQYAMIIHDAKLRTAMKVFANSKQDPFENFLSEYGDIAKNVKSVIPIPSSEKISVKDRKALNWYYDKHKKVGMKKIASAADDENLIFKDYSLF